MKKVKISKQIICFTQLFLLTVKYSHDSFSSFFFNSTSRAMMWFNCMYRDRFTYFCFTWLGAFFFSSNITQTHFLNCIIREKENRHEKVNACMWTIIAFGGLQQKIDCELFIWCIWSFMEYWITIWILCHFVPNRGYRFAVDIWQLWTKLTHISYFSLRQFSPRK